MPVGSAPITYEPSSRPWQKCRPASHQRRRRLASRHWSASIPTAKRTSWNGLRCTYAKGPNLTATSTTRHSQIRMGLDIGSRNIRTGLTPIDGHLDDHGVAVVKTAIDALAAPVAESDGMKDTRSPANRSAHALVAALRGYLDAGQGPTEGRERPHVTIVLNWDVVSGAIADAHDDTAAAVSPAQARKFLCDAEISPVILGSEGEIVDVGRRPRTFPAAIRRAAAIRDGGSAWPACNRPQQWCDAHHVIF